MKGFVCGMLDLVAKFVIIFYLENVPCYVNESIGPVSDHGICEQVEFVVCPTLV